MYVKEELFEKAKRYISKHNLFSVADLIALLGVSTNTYYKYFPKDSFEFNEIHLLLEKNKAYARIEIRKKLAKSNKASELISLYKLCANDDENRMLNQNYIEVNGRIETPITIMLNRIVSDNVNENPLENKDTKLIEKEN